jgi:hypothetical protein
MTGHAWASTGCHNHGLEATTDHLSILDVVCLVLAMPPTVFYKAVTCTAPFLDNSGTSTLSEATSWQKLKNVMDCYGGSNKQSDHTVCAMAHMARNSDASPI